MGKGRKKLARLIEHQKKKRAKMRKQKLKPSLEGTTKTRPNEHRKKKKAKGA